MKIIKRILGTFFLLETIMGIGMFLFHEEFRQNAFAAILTISFFAFLTFVCFKKQKHEKKDTEFECRPNKLDAPENTSQTPSAQYVETGKMIYRTDGKSITDEEVPYLMQIGYERALENVKHPLSLTDLNEQETIFFDELEKALSEINRTIHAERMSNGTISVYSNGYYVGKIRLVKQKHWMQILRGETQIRTIEGELNDFIQHIPDWTRYIRLHCK